MTVKVTKRVVTERISLSSFSTKQCDKLAVNYVSKSY